MDDKYWAMIVGGAFAAIGGLVNYLWQTMKPEADAFTVKFFVLNGILAFFIGLVVGDWIPDDVYGRDGILLVCGFSTYRILAFFEDYGFRLIKRFLPAKNEDGS